ncbi:MULTISPECIES: murein biosynthesis integral membrane protein MurJ [Acidocella]|uniref:murein biosynthesis integral membrane protein MurJ n=1 Tax=Acidocella TaxID=50709 RepID=UPI00028E927C|nr:MULTISPECIES: murein biosynthesis integral membrane protein MurJ [Acidocella]EKM98809.1 virulence factor mviN [Acidocella sp. MX-AZ02]WBO58742.1 murein biosynthesis integral membrane protein MurJ [Acidocella sp. MX-AZ03]
MIRGAFTVGAWTMASRVLGFVRDILIAAVLGTGPVADAFFVALRLPNLFRRLFGEGAFNAAFVPAISTILHKQGLRAATDFAEEATAVMAFWLGGITIIGEIFMPWLLYVLAPGFAGHGGRFDLAVGMSRVMFPYLFFICLTALFSGVLNAMSRFAAAAAAPVLFNLFMIAAMLWLAPYTRNPGYALAWGVTVSGVAQLALVLWAIRRAGMRFTRPKLRFSPHIRQMFRRMAPALVGAGVTQLNVSIDIIIGTLLPAGSVSILYYADRVNQLPLGVIATAAGTALLPAVTRNIALGEEAEANTALNRAFESVLMLTLPAAIGLSVAAKAVMDVAFVRGAFSAHDAVLAGRSLAAFALGLPVFALIKIFTPGFYARGDTVTPLKIGIFAVLLNLGLNLLFMHPLKAVGPALATSLSSACNALLLFWLLRRRGHFRFDALSRRRIPRILLAGVVMAAALWGVQRLLPQSVASLPYFLLLVVVGALFYFGPGLALKAFDLAGFLGLLRRRKRG